MATSSTVANGDLATAAQYNDLRTDVLSTHVHDGTDGNSALKASSVFPASGNLTLRTAAGADVLIGDDITLMFVDGGSPGVKIGSAAILADTHFDVDPNTRTVAVDANGRVMFVRGSLTEAASGTHAILAGIEISPPIITGAGASTTNGVTLRISGAPTIGATNYSLWVDDGNSRFDGDIVGATGAGFRLSTSALTFQEATTIITTAGDLDFNPAGEIKIQKRMDFEIAGSVLEQVASGSGAQNLWKIENTSTSDSSTATMLIKVNGTGTGSNTWLEWGTSATWSMGIDENSATENDSLVISDASNLGAADLMRFKASTNEVFLDNNHGANFDYVCDQCGLSGCDPFLCCGIVAWHDDNLSIVKYTRGDITPLVHLGVISIDGPDALSPGYRMLNINRAFDLTWCGMAQAQANMEALRRENQELRGRLQLVEAMVL